MTIVHARDDIALTTLRILLGVVVLGDSAGADGLIVRPLTAFAVSGIFCIMSGWVGAHWPRSFSMNSFGQHSVESHEDGLSATAIAVPRLLRGGSAASIDSGS